MHNRTLQALNNRQLMVQQAENAILAYTVNWEAVLDGDTISTSTWTAENGGTVASESNTTLIAEAQLSGDPGRYRFTNKITTAAGDTDERQIVVVVTDNDLNTYSDYCS